MKDIYIGDWTLYMVLGRRKKKEIPATLPSYGKLDKSGIPTKPDPLKSFNLIKSDGLITGLYASTEENEIGIRVEYDTEVYGIIVKKDDLSHACLKSEKYTRGIDVKLNGLKKYFEVVFKQGANDGTFTYLAFSFDFSNQVAKVIDENELPNQLIDQLMNQPLSKVSDPFYKSYSGLSVN
jgi:hypothetical protein